MNFSIFIGTKFGKDNNVLIYFQTRPSERHQKEVMVYYLFLLQKCKFEIIRVK
jgi:hypothetical protein